MKRVVVLAVVAACSNPPLALRFALTDGDSQSCISDTGNKTTDCSEVTVGCDPVLSIRILPPSDPLAPYVSLCKPLVGAQNKLCSIAGIDLPQPTVPIPEQTLEVQMAIFPKSAVSTDPISGELVCPIVQFGADNLPISVTCSGTDATCPTVPAVGGRAFYHPGDAETVVDLGCTDPVQLQATACSGQNTIVVSASVTDFDNQQLVTSSLAQRLIVSIGEPQPLGDVYVFGIGPTSPKVELGLLPNTPQPAWQGNVGLSFMNTACLDVREDAAETTSTLTCQEIKTPLGSRLDATGVRLSKATLDKILLAIGQTSFPAHGLVVGIVLDSTNTPLPGVTVAGMSRVLSTPQGTITYLSQDLMTTVTGGTSASGVFVSEDAPYDTRFDAQSPSLEAEPAFGGLVDGKVTIVIIRFKPPSTGG